MQRRRHTRSPRAFTLIELLIVVAIIAILAAIAVPNFLEAQVRSKVSRVQSDQRSIATAIESYAIDHNRPPLGYIEWWDVTNCAFDDRDWCYSQITTPVAYMTSVPRDPFAKFIVPDSGYSSRDELRAYHYLTHYQTPSGTAGRAMAMARGYIWSLYSVGPPGQDGPPWCEWMLGDPKGTDAFQRVYDPTNGTKSWGRIMRTNKGLYPDAGVTY